MAGAQGTITAATLIESVTTAAYATIVAGQGNFASLAERDPWTEEGHQPNGRPIPAKLLSRGTACGAARPE